MNRILSLMVICASILATVSCKKDVDYFYTTEFVYVNHTNHDVRINIQSDYTPMAAVVERGETFSKKWTEIGPLPFDIKGATVTFDEKHTVTFTPDVDPNSSENICREENYVMTRSDDAMYHWVYTYNITESDYDYAVSANEKD